MITISEVWMVCNMVEINPYLEIGNQFVFSRRLGMIRHTSEDQFCYHKRAPCLLNDLSNVA